MNIKIIVPKISGYDRKSFKNKRQMWCDENIGPQHKKWDSKVIEENKVAYFFATEEDAVLFSLKWL